ncbi:hypothetical protein IU487_32290 [Nocardia puris]|uniref:hypothetical protein n=1 Tax=Nocardia puris TaxID=208602 RepID=UPI0018933534|nr:hypothetical protein [Nocardia puris]MBF6215679.1 hypothetical protein [Nocardia puris]
MRRPVIAPTVSLTALIAVALTGSACTNDSDEKGRPGAVSRAQTAHVDPAIRTGLAVGLDDGVEGHSAAGSAEYFEAHCFADGDQLSVQIDSVGGWTVWLKHGSQTLVAENATLGLPRAEFTTGEGTIRNSRALITNEDKQFPLGITWDRPAVGDVEVKLKEEAPSTWNVTPGTNFVTYLHISCGG